MSPRRLEHGTPEGYARGCTQHAKCPALPVHGLTCETAHIRFESGERRYLMLRGRNLPAAAIAARLGFTPPRATDADLAETATDGPTRDVEAEIAAYAAAKEARDRSNPNTVAPGLTPPAAPDLPVCPECVAGKHTNCDDTALDTTSDEIVACRCTHPTAPVPARKEPTMAETTPNPTPTPQLTTDPYTAGLNAREKKLVLASIRDWARANNHEVPAHGRIPQTALAAFAAAGGLTALNKPTDNEVTPDDASDSPRAGIVTAHEDVDEVAAPLKPVNSADFEEMLNHVRERADMPKPTSPIDHAPPMRPEYATVAATVDPDGLLLELEATRTALEQVTAERDRARDLAAHLEADNAVHVTQLGTMGTALEFTLHEWSKAASTAALAENGRRFLRTQLKDSNGIINHLNQECARLRTELADERTSASTPTPRHVPETRARRLFSRGA